MDKYKKWLKRRIKHADIRINALEASHGDNPNQTHNYFGGKTMGYWVGLKNGYQSVIDLIERDEGND